MSEQRESRTTGAAQAVRAAMRTLPEFIDRPAVSVRVEEVFPPRDGGTWRITLSHMEVSVEKPKHPALAAIEGPFRMPPALERVFHVFEVEAESGEVVAMRLREEP